MNYNITWNKRYEIGVELIDKEHKQLFLTMDRLLKICEEENKSIWACREGIKYLKNHTVDHFVHEEELMQAMGLADYELHKRLHDDFRYNTLPSLERELEDTNYSEQSMKHFLAVCIGWVVSHTQLEDQVIAGKSVSKWADVPHEMEMDILKQTIIQLGMEVLQSKVRLVSEQYMGEYFGKMMFCRFLYRGKNKERYEVMLGYEESLLLKIVSDILGTEYLKMDEMAVNITRYLSRQFLAKLQECFAFIGDCQMASENLMTHEQLLDSFERAHPSCSLLFNTGKGYFAFCVTTSDSLQGKIVPTITEEKAMGEIRKFLAGEKRKKNILVVDDSDFMRRNIKNLLEAKYEIIESHSSTSAIKTITANKPDLILLDYEMPVCDGRQTLEMIRSDRELADIPVIFLTGRGDEESVRKVMALKPDGYLLKTMPQNKIREAVDSFFEKREAKV